MNNENIFEQLADGSPVDERKLLLRDYLRKQLEWQEQHADQSEMIAYKIAGLLSTDLLMQLDGADPYVQALGLAGELELPERQRSSTATWKKLAELVRRL